MIPFHSVEASQAVTEFAPPRPERFRELSAAKDFIAELRKKRASFRSIADLLTRHSLPISKSAVAEFCHEVLGEIPFPINVARANARRLPIYLKANHFLPSQRHLSCRRPAIHQKPKRMSRPA